MNKSTKELFKVLGIDLCEVCELPNKKLYNADWDFTTKRIIFKICGNCKEYTEDLFFPIAHIKKAEIIEKLLKNRSKNEI